MRYVGNPDPVPAFDFTCKLHNIGGAKHTAIVQCTLPVNAREPGGSEQLLANKRM
jgi:hypothetical protein